MMQSFGGLLAGICFAAALGGLVQLLSPGGSTERMLRLAVTLFILAAAAVPLGAVVRSAAVRPTHAREDLAAEAVLQTAEEALRQTARTVLDKYGFPDAFVDVAAQNRNGEVHAKHFVITGVAPEKAQEIAHEIYTLTGELPQMEAVPAILHGG